MNLKVGVLWVSIQNISFSNKTIVKVLSCEIVLQKILIIDFPL